MKDYKLNQKAITIGELALKAILLEVSAAPKPGLVDRYNSGAHKDMDFFIFMASSASLAFWFNFCAQLGLEHQGEPAKLLPKIRRMGVKAEKHMFQSTRGINTQKGLLFLLGTAAAATGFLTNKTKRRISPEKICKMVGEICKGLEKKELVNLTDKTARTAGEKLYLRYKFKGMRGEVESGLPTVLNAGLPSFTKAINNNLTFNDAIIHSLITIMTVAEDTTILARHGIETLKKAQSSAREILEVGSMFTEEGRNKISELDKRFINENISPGGTADLIAVTIFLHLYRKKA